MSGPQRKMLDRVKQIQVRLLICRMLNFTFYNDSFIRDALEDMEIILTELKDRYNSKALIVKGDALYNLGNFEHALLCFHRASKNATSKEKVGIGQRITRCELAIFNAVGPTASSYFKNLDKFLYKIPSNIMGLPWFQLKRVVDANARQSRV